MDLKGTISELNFAIAKCNANIAQSKKEIKSIEESKTALCRAHNVCDYCYGDGYTYVDSKNDGDPYHKSSDDRIACPCCGGSGKFTRKEAKSK